MSAARPVSGPRIIVALDFPEAAAALKLSDRLPPQLCRLKVGKELFTAAGPALVETLTKRGFDVFLDLKYHDIPSTAAQACKAAASLGVWMLNVHALGGRAMLVAAREALEGTYKQPLLIAVTVLTSHSDADLRELGIEGTAQSAVLRLAQLARDCGLDGVVCSALEASVLRHALGEAFLLVTPGIRTEADPAGDQKRIVTPGAAVRMGASLLVVGRPITRAADPLAALTAIDREVTQAASNSTA